jgi:hypothetical protein
VRLHAKQDDDLSLTLAELLSTGRGKAELALLALALVGMAPFVVLEVGTLLAYGWGWLDGTNVIDFLTYSIQVPARGKEGMSPGAVCVHPALVWQLPRKQGAVSMLVGNRSSTAYQGLLTARPGCKARRVPFLAVCSRAMRLQPPPLT